MKSVSYAGPHRVGRARTQDMFGRHAAARVILPISLLVACLFQPVQSARAQGAFGGPIMDTSAWTIEDAPAHQRAKHYQRELERICKTLDDANDKLADAKARESIGQMYVTAFFGRTDQLEEQGRAWTGRQFLSEETAEYKRFKALRSKWVEKRNAANADIKKIEDEIKIINLNKASTKDSLNEAIAEAKKPPAPPKPPDTPLTEEERRFAEVLEILELSINRIGPLVDQMVRHLEALHREGQDIVTLGRDVYLQGATGPRSRTYVETLAGEVLRRLNEPVGTTNADEALRALEDTLDVADQDEEAEEQIIIPGSRIPRADLTATQPINPIDSEEIVLSSPIVGFYVGGQVGKGVQTDVLDLPLSQQFIDTDTGGDPNVNIEAGINHPFVVRDGSGRPVTLAELFVGAGYINVQSTEPKFVGNLFFPGILPVNGTTTLEGGQLKAGVNLHLFGRWYASVMGGLGRVEQIVRLFNNAGQIVFDAKDRVRFWTVGAGGFYRASIPGDGPVPFIDFGMMIEQTRADDMTGPFLANGGLARVGGIEETSISFRFRMHLMNRRSAQRMRKLAEIAAQLDPGSDLEPF